MSGWDYFYYFVAGFLILIFSAQAYFYYQSIKIVCSSKRPILYRRTITGIFSLLNIALLSVIFFHFHTSHIPKWFMYIAVYPFYTWHFSLFIAFLAILFWWIVKMPFLAFGWVIKKMSWPRRFVESIRHNERIVNFDLHRRMFIRRSATVIVCAAFASSAYGIVRRDDFEIEDVRIAIKNLPEPFHNFTIGLVSDIHSSVFMMKEQMEIYAGAVNGMKTDLIAVTGDFVTSKLEEIYPFAEAFHVLHAPSGVYGVLGNHDYFTRDVDLLAHEVDNCGIRLLRNDRIAIEKGGKKLYLLGVDDAGSFRRALSLFDATLAGTAPEVPKIMMCHRPYFFEQAADRNIDLTLSGHTHGGQVVFARVGNSVLAAARFASPYVSGLYERGGKWMYVSRGIGTVGIPLRLNCPPELTRITLINSA